jgi:hypothetical protein
VTESVALPPVWVSVMTGLKERIAELETRAAEFELIAGLATDPEARARNARLAEEINKTVDLLCEQKYAA